MNWQMPQDLWEKENEEEQNTHTRNEQEKNNNNKKKKKRNVQQPNRQKIETMYLMK